MHLGTQTNSLTNHIYARGTIGQPKPDVGMGATILLWSDRNPATITSVIEIGGSKKFLYEITVVEDGVKVVKGSQQDGSAEYKYTPRLDGYVMTFRSLKATGQWMQCAKDENGKPGYRKGQGHGLRIGEREKYYDPSF